MALPLLFFIGSSLIRAATPVIAKMLVKQGYKRASGAVVKNALKNSKKIRTIGSKKDIPIAKSKSLTIPKNQSTALTKINKTTGGNKSKLVNGKVVTAATTIASIPALLAKKDDKKGQAKADTKKKVLPGRMEGGPPQRKGTTSTATAMTFGKAFRAAKDAGKKEFTYKGKKYHTRTKDEDKKATANPPIPKSRPKTEKKVEKKIEKKVDAPLKKVQKNITAGKNTGFGPKGNIFPTSPEERKELIKKYGGTGSEAAKNSKVGKQGNRKGIGRA
jgi:hypothetical protein